MPLMNSPHPFLVLPRKKFEVSWEVFSKKGRTEKGVREKREVWTEEELF